MRDDSKVQTYSDNMFLCNFFSLLFLPLLACMKEIISEADNRDRCLMRLGKMLLMLTSLSRCALWRQQKIHEKLLSNYYQSNAILASFFFFPSPFFSRFSAYSVSDRWCSLQKSNARIKDNVPENHLFCAMDCDCIAMRIPQSINLQTTASCVRGILKMRTALLYSFESMICNTIIKHNRCSLYFLLFQLHFISICVI